MRRGRRYAQTGTPTVAAMLRAGRSVTCRWTALRALGDVEHELLGLLPTDARVGNRLAVHAAVDGLVAVLQVAFHHKAADDTVDGLVAAAGVEHLLGDAQLLERALAGVVVVAVHHHTGVGVAGLLGIALGQTLEVLVMVMG